MRRQRVLRDGAEGGGLWRRRPYGHVRNRMCHCNHHAGAVSIWLSYVIVLVELIQVRPNSDHKKQETARPTLIHRRSLPTVPVSFSAPIGRTYSTAPARTDPPLTRPTVTSSTVTTSATATTTTSTTSTKTATSKRTTKRIKRPPATAAIPKPMVGATQGQWAIAVGGTRRYVSNMDTVELVSLDPEHHPVPRCLKQRKPYPLKIHSAVGAWINGT